MTQFGIRTERPEERLLEGVIGAIATQAADEKAVDLVAMLLVEMLERRQRHVDIL